MTKLMEKWTIHFDLISIKAKRSFSVGSLIWIIKRVKGQQQNLINGKLRF